MTPIFIGINKKEKINLEIFKTMFTFTKAPSFFTGVYFKNFSQTKDYLDKSAIFNKKRAIENAQFRNTNIKFVYNLPMMSVFGVKMGEKEKYVNEILIKSQISIGIYTNLDVKKYLRN